MPPGGSELPNDERLRRAVEATVTRYHQLGSAPVIDDLACFCVDRDRPDVYDANHVRSPRAASPDEIECLLLRIEDVYAGQAHREVVCAVDTPDAFEARLSLDGWELDRTLHHVLTGPLLIDRTEALLDVAIRPATGADDWRSMTALTRVDHVESCQKFARELWDLGTTESMVAHRRAKAPEVQAWLASVDGADVGFLSSMPGDNGVGLVEDLFVHPDARGRGIALALLDWCVADARTRGAVDVTLASRPDDWPGRLYARLGFRPLFVERNWERHVEAPASPR
jgi:GNAT superfamily N-acetyltransferase